MQLPQEHPKHTHDVLKSASISWYNHCCYIFDFLFTCHKKCQQPKLPIRDRQLAARSAPQDLGHGSVQLPSLPNTKPASCPFVHNISQTSCSSQPSPTSWKHSYTVIDSQTSFLCPQFRELLESFLLHLTGVTATKQPIKISMGDYILTSINSYASFTAVEGLVFFWVKRASLKCICSRVILGSLRAGHKPSDLEQGTPLGLQWVLQHRLLPGWPHRGSCHCPCCETPPAGQRSRGCRVRRGPCSGCPAHLACAHIQHQAQLPLQAWCSALH